jgi:CRP/FNR family transcriptional regulator, dissimilatory nitrate respiration regulator
MKSALSNSILFSGIEESEIKIIEKAAHKIRSAKGNYLFFQDDPAENFYLVISGKVKVFKTSPDGKEQILLMAGPGESFGEAALFAERKYPATAETIESGELFVFSREAFIGLVTRHPMLAMNMIARLSMLLHHLTKLVEQLSLEDVGTRLAGYIVELLPPEGEPGPQTIILSEKKMVLASLLGTIPETLSRALARLSGLGVISVEGQEITILDRPKLTEIASGKKI